jgi:flagellar assembly protein FliH
MTSPYVNMRKIENAIAELFDAVAEEARKEGHGDGYAKGYDEGYGDGYAEGEAAGFDNGVASVEKAE